MGIFKNLLTLKPKIIKQEPQKNTECWYNNANETADSKLGVPMEGAALSSDNAFENTVAQNIAPH